MCGFSTVTESLSESAATSRIKATVWVLCSPPSSAAKTVSLTGPPSFSNSFFTATSSCAVRNAMAEVYPLPRSRARWRPAHDLEGSAVAGGVDARAEERGARACLGRDERRLETGLLGGREDPEAEGPGEGAGAGAGGPGPSERMEAPA